MNPALSRQVRRAVKVVCRWRAAWVVDFEFSRDPNGRPDPICLAAYNLLSGETIVLWRDQMGAVPPYDIGEDAVFICYSGQEAELACHLALGWALPANVIDLIVCYRMAINGRGGNQRIGLLDAMLRLGLTPQVSPEEKKRAQQRCIQGWPFTLDDQTWLKGYVLSDVQEEVELTFDLVQRGFAVFSDHAAWHGEFIKELAKAWWRGVPIDPQYVPLLVVPEKRLQLRQTIIDDVSREVPVYKGGHRKTAELAKWFLANDIPIPLTPKGNYSFAIPKLERLAAAQREADDPANRDIGETLEAFTEAQRVLAQLRDTAPPIGADNRLRAWFAPFLTKTSRAAPPTDEYIYNLPAWVRALMQASKSSALAYLDFKAMEFGLAAALSHCPNMRAFYATGDPYWATILAVGAAPPNTSPKTDPELKRLRERYKTGLLACLYGIGVETLAQRLKCTRTFARRFLDMHHDLFAEYWRWSDRVVAGAIHNGYYLSRHGWYYRVQPPIDARVVRSLRNWLIQTLGADILRCAVIFAGTIGRELLATAHDAMLIQVSETEIHNAVAEVVYWMQLASELLTGGFVLGVDNDVKLRGGRFLEDRGKRTFVAVEQFVIRNQGGGAYVPLSRGID